MCAEGRERDFLKLNKMTGFGKRCGAMLLAAGATLLIGTARAAGDSTARVRFDYDVRLGTFIDNGEYNSDYKAPKTLSGVWVMPTVGMRFGGGGEHRIMTGIGFLQQFGQKPFGQVPDFVAYYNYAGRVFNGFGGLLPRDEMRGYYSRALFSDSVGYFKRTLAGALLRWEGTRGGIEAFFDWNAEDTKTGKESFMAGLAGELNLGRRQLFRIGLAGYMYHYRLGERAVEAGEAPNFLVDNAMYHLYGGFDLGELTPLDVLSLDAGIVGSLSRGRIAVGNAGGWTARAGFHARFNIEWHGWGIEDTFFAGKGLMPLYDVYGTQVYWGDAFYNAPLYNRTDLYWSKTLVSWLSIRAALVLHQTARGIDFCQQASVRVHLWK